MGCCPPVNGSNNNNKERVLNVKKSGQAEVIYVSNYSHFHSLTTE